MLGRPLRTVSPDAGASDALLDVAGQPLMVWKTGGLLLFATFDALRRRTRLTVTENGTSSIREVVQFGESASNPETHFLRGKPWRLWDTAGRVETPEYDFKGNPRAGTHDVPYPNPDRTQLEMTYEEWRQMHPDQDFK